MQKALLSNRKGQQLVGSGKKDFHKINTERGNAAS